MIRYPLRRMSVGDILIDVKGETMATKKKAAKKKAKVVKKTMHKQLSSSRRASPAATERKQDWRTIAATKTRNQVMAKVGKNPKSCAEIATALGITHITAKRALDRLIADGSVTSEGSRMKRVYTRV